MLSLYGMMSSLRNANRIEKRLDTGDGYLAVPGILLYGLLKFFDRSQSYNRDKAGGYFRNWKGNPNADSTYKA